MVLLPSVFAVLISVSLPAAAPAPMRFVHNAPESAGDIRYDYQWEILRNALDRTRKSWGPYVLENAPEMSERRQTDEMGAGSANINVMFLGSTPELERELVPVRIPVDRNLSGYFILMTLPPARARLRAARSAADLKGLRWGLGLGWLDVDILRRNGFNVVTGSSYEGLFQMLANGRFDVFPRAVVEVLGEFERVHPRFPEIELDPNLLFYYPLPMYFWFQRNAEGRRMAARVREGMLAMIADGSYARIFERYQGWKIRRLKLERRRLISVPNPLLGPETPFKDRRLWYRLPGQEVLNP